MWDIQNVPEFIELLQPVCHIAPDDKRPMMWLAENSRAPFLNQ